MNGIHMTRIQAVEIRADAFLLHPSGAAHPVEVKDNHHSDGWNINHLQNYSNSATTSEEMKCFHNAK